MANQRAFKKTLVANGTQAAQVQALFVALQNAVTDAGFAVLSTSATHIDIMQAGLIGADTGDDAPHWAIEMVGTQSIAVHAVHGVAWDDANAKVTYNQIISGTDFPDTTPDLLVRFYCDSTTGMLWFYATNTSTLAHKTATVCCRLRRYPGDTTQGILPRYGMLFPTGSDRGFKAPYATTVDASQSADARFDLWSVLMSSNMSSPRRHAASPMPAMAAPLFLHDNNWLPAAASACLPGELEQVQLLTSSAAGDYTLEQVLSPGVMALPDTNPSAMHLALPYTTFTVL